MQGSLLNEQALVLNRSWAAIATTSVREALSMLFTGAAKAIRTETFEAHEFESWASLNVSDDEPCVRTVSLRIKVPEVIVLTSYNGMPVPKPTFSRRNLYRRDANTCQYCSRRPGTSELTIDHVMPRSRGGKSSWTNCVLACVACNSRKGSRLLAQAGMHLIKPPAVPRWTPIMEVPITRVRQSWKRFVSDRYWDTTLTP
jgi:5-methylcytosine-specific restriction endonuclease McrA